MHPRNDPQRRIEHGSANRNGLIGFIVTCQRHHRYAFAMRHPGIDQHIRQTPVTSKKLRIMLEFADLDARRPISAQLDNHHAPARPIKHSGKHNAALPITDNQDERFLLRRGTLQQTMGKDEPALADFRAAREKDPKLAPAWWGEAKTLVMIISPFFGAGDDGLGSRLMKNFLATLPELGDSLWRIVMLNGGVTLAVDDSPVIEELRRLEQAGVSILVCGTCLEHFGVLARKAVGQTTNMLDVVTSMQLADKVIRV